MPRDSAGNYTLPAGNPVSSGEVISATWANTTMSDLGDSIAASLDRYGRGGMLAPFAFSDGTVTAPGAAWSNEPTSGFYRSSYGDIRITVTGVDRQRWTDSGTQLWNPATGAWQEIVTTEGGNIPAAVVNDLTVLDSFQSPGISDNATQTVITIAADNSVTAESLDVTQSVTAASFTGDGSNLTGITLPASEITDGDMAFTGDVNIDGSVTATSFTGDGANLTNLPIPQTLSADKITDGDMAFTGSVDISGPITATSFAGDGSALTNLPVADTLSADKITDGAMAYTGSITIDGVISGTSFSGDGSALTNLPQTGITEAPEDGKQYAREDAGWTEVAEGVPEAPEDGKQYAREDAGWTEVAEGISEAPEDGKQYARESAGWTEVVAATSLPASAITDGAMAYTGSINIDGDITGTTVKGTDFIETVREPRYQGGTATLELNLGNNFTMDFSGATSYALGLSGAPSATGDAYGFTLTLDTTNMAGLAWDTKIKWSGGAAPTLTADSTYVFTFLSTDGGATFKGFVGGEGFA